MICAMALVYLTREVAAIFRLRILSIIGECVARDLRTALYEHMQRLSLAFFSRKKTGSLITRITADPRNRQTSRQRSLGKTYLQLWRMECLLH